MTKIDSDSVRHDHRNDFRTAQIVDAVIMYLTADGIAGNAMRYMKRHSVPSTVQHRVLNNTARIRRKSLESLRHNITRMMEIEIDR